MKAALEVAAGASYAGARTMVTMKQVGLNVASDPLMSLAYVGIKGGMVVVVGRSGPISSQTEQDTPRSACIPSCPCSTPPHPRRRTPWSQTRSGSPRSTARRLFCAPPPASATGTRPLLSRRKNGAHAEGFVKGDSRWVIFPRTSFLNHQKIEARNAALSSALSRYPKNAVTGAGRKGVAAGGVSYAYPWTRSAIRRRKCSRWPRLSPFPTSLRSLFWRGWTKCSCWRSSIP